MINIKLLLLFIFSALAYLLSLFSLLSFFPFWGMFLSWTIILLALATLLELKYWIAESVFEFADPFRLWRAVTLNMNKILKIIIIAHGCVPLFFIGVPGPTVENSKDPFLESVYLAITALFVLFYANKILKLKIISD